ncbi:MAG: cytochrome P450 [Jatrophihabitantaceae bacterium]
MSAILAQLNSAAAQHDPYPLYAQLHARGPISFAPDGALVAVGYSQCGALLREHRLRKAPGRLLAAAGYPDWMEHPALRMMFASMLMLNPPEHTRLRRAVSVAFTPTRVAALVPAITRITQDRLDELDGRSDFIEAFAFPLPVAVIGELLGIPAGDRAMFQDLSRDWTAVLDTLDHDAVARADRAATAIETYLGDLATTRAAHPADDLISALVTTGEPLARTDLLTTVALLLAAGFETTTSLLANSLLALLAHPRQAHLLRTEPRLATAAVEELLRYDTPVQVLYGRTVVDELSIDALIVPAGTRVLTMVGAANRDPSVYADPDDLDLRRDGPPPLSFGGGIHYCLGAPLARLEAQLALPLLLQRYPHLSLAGEPVRRDGLTLRGYAQLPVVTN